MQPDAELAGTIARRLAVLRANRTESQRDIAESTGVTLSVLNAAIRGASVPSPGALIRLARYYGVSVDWLLGETDRRPRQRTKAAS